jgi:hypothetical protein
MTVRFNQVVFQSVQYSLHPIHEADRDAEHLCVRHVR